MNRGRSRWSSWSAGGRTLSSSPASHARSTKPSIGRIHRVRAPVRRTRHRAPVGSSQPRAQVSADWNRIALTASILDGAGRCQVTRGPLQQRGAREAPGNSDARDCCGDASGGALRVCHLVARVEDERGRGVYPSPASTGRRVSQSGVWVPESPATRWRASLRSGLHRKVRTRAIADGVGHARPPGIECPTSAATMCVRSGVRSSMALGFPPVLEELVADELRTAFGTITVTCRRLHRFRGDAPRTPPMSD